MSRSLIYPMLFVVSALLQLFLFDNLFVWIYFCPLVYIAFIALLPLDYAPVKVLLSGLLMGVTMDFMMGAAGENTIATVLVAFMRPTILNLIYNREDVRESGIPSPVSLGGNLRYATYLTAVVVLHHGVFFSLEALSWPHALHTLARVVVSSIVSIICVWLISELFSARKTAKRI